MFCSLSHYASSLLVLSLAFWLCFTCYLMYIVFDSFQECYFLALVAQFSSPSPQICLFIPDGPFVARCCGTAMFSDNSVPAVRRVC